MASSHPSPLVSSDLVWEVARNTNSFLVKRRSGGGVQFSRDPLNVANVNSRKYVGFANDKALGLQAGKNGEIHFHTKKLQHQHQPASGFHKTHYGRGRSSRKIYKSIVGTTAKNSYRADLRSEAVSRVSALRAAAGIKKDTPERKPRGAKARKAAADP